MDKTRLKAIVNNKIAEYNDEELIQLFHQNTKQGANYVMDNMHMSREIMSNSEVNQKVLGKSKSYPFSHKVRLLERISDEFTSLLEKRHSQVHKEIEHKISIQEVSEVLWAGYGKTSRGRRTVGSGGALYPCELYPIILNSSDTPHGLYHYNPETCMIELLSDEDKIFNYRNYIMGLDNFNHISLIVLVTASFGRMDFKYDARSYRYILIEVGSIVQNMALAATKYGLMSCQMGGTDDRLCEKLLGIDGVSESIVKGMVFTRG